MCRRVIPAATDVSLTSVRMVPTVMSSKAAAEPALPIDAALVVATDIYGTSTRIASVDTPGNCTTTCQSVEPA